MAKKRRGRELPSEEDMSRIILDLKSHGDGMTALMGAAYLEHMIEEVLRARFRPMSANDDQAMFDVGKGLLATFMGKARMAYALGIVDSPTFDGLKVIAGIRNRFAHPLSPVTFGSPEIEAECLKLTHVPWFVMTHAVARPGGVAAMRFGQSGPTEAEVTALDVYAGTCLAIYTGLLGARILAVSEGAKVGQLDGHPPMGPTDG